MIEGKATPHIAEKYNIDSFLMTVDGETGIFLYLDGYLNGKTTRYMHVTEIAFDRKIEVKQFDVSAYAGYNK